MLIPRLCPRCYGRKVVSKWIKPKGREAYMIEVTCDGCAGSGVDPKSWPDDALVAAYQRTDGAPGNPEADALLAEIQQRNLDL